EHPVAQCLDLSRHGTPQRGVVLDRQYRFAAARRKRRRQVLLADPRARACARQIEAQGRADAGLAIEVDVTARLLDEAEHHAEPEPGPLAALLRRIERVENAPEDVRRDADA